jgi:hypothetical protein
MYSSKVQYKLSFFLVLLLAFDIPGHDKDIQDFERNRQSQGENIIDENDCSFFSEQDQQKIPGT